MKTLKFADYLVPLIISGEKTSTWRLFDDKDLSVGDEVIFVNKNNGQEFSMAKITAVKEKKLGDITDEDYDGHEKYESNEKMIESLRAFYGDQVTTDTTVKIVDFEIINR